jgi:hypothetical protein
MITVKRKQQNNVSTGWVSLTHNPRLESSQIQNFLRNDVMPQLENSILGLMQCHGQHTKLLKILYISFRLCVWGVYEM